MNPSKLLSQREQEVVNLLLKGKSNKQMALLLNVSERTVEFHLKNIYTKLHVRSRVELVLKLWKTTSNIESLELGKITVDTRDENIHNGDQPTTETRWGKGLKKAQFLVTKEIVMAKTVILDDVGNFLRKHPLFLGLLQFLIASFAARYLIITFGLYFWLSYILLGLILGAGSLYFGISWDKVKLGKIYFRPSTIVGLVLLPVLVAVVDIVFVDTVARITGQSVVNMAGIYNKAVWLISPEGKSYLYRERIIYTEDLWFFTMLYMLFLAVIGSFLGKKFTKKDKITAKSV